MPIFGTGQKRLDGRTNPQINATLYTTLAANYPKRRTGGPLLGYRLALLDKISTLVVSNAALWLDTYDANFLSSNPSAGNFTPGSANPTNNTLVGGIIDKASQCNATSAVGRLPNYNLFGLNNYPTLTYVQLTPLNNRIVGGPPPYLGSSMSMFCVFNVGNNSPTGNIVTVSDNQSTPSNQGMGIYYNSNNRTIGINRGNTVFSTSYTLQSSVLVSAYVNGTSLTIGGLVPSTMSMNINGAQTNMSSLGSLLSSFSTPYYSMGGVNNTGQTNTSISEFIVYYRTLNNIERTSVENQLITKWGLQSNAPISYINSLPVTNGLFGWYDAYDQTTVLRNASNNVSMWLDKSGQSNHMSTNLLTFGSNTRSNIYYSSIGVSTNSFPTLFFPSTFAIMQTSSLITNQSFSTFTMISVANYQKNLAQSGIGIRSVALGSTLNAQDNTFLGRDSNYAGGYNIPNTALQVGFSTIHINTMIVNLGSTTDTGLNSLTENTYYNGGNVQSLNLTGGYTGMIVPSYVRLMGSMVSGFSGDTTDLRVNSGYLSEVLLYNRILSNTELSNVHRYLLNKWNISTLVSNVPVTRGLNLWLDAYDPATVITDSNSNVLLWRDKSLFQRNFSNVGGNTGPPTFVAQGANSLPSVRFTNTFNTNAGQGLINSNFYVSSISSISIFMVKQVIVSGSTSFPQSFSMYSTISFNNGNNEFFIYEDSNGVATSLRRATQNYYNSVNNRNLSVASYIINSSNVALNDIPASNYGLVFNGVKVGAPVDGLTPSTFNTTIGLLGTNASGIINNTVAYNGYINEVLFYNTALTFNERQQIESYLLSKWNI